MPRLNVYKPIPADPKDYFEPAEIDRARSYNRPLQVWGILYSATMTVFGVVVVGTHAVPRSLAAIGITPWPLQLLIALFALIIAFTLVSIPFDVWNHLHEKRWALTDMTLRGAVVEELRNFVFVPLAAVIFLPMWAVVRATPEWWIFAALVYCGFNLVLGVLYPAVLQPIIERLSPVDEDVMGSVIRLTREAGLGKIGVFQQDASRRTRRENASLNGIGPWRRVVLYDNLLARPMREVDVVLAHEIGHWKRRHMTIKVALNLTLTIAQFALIKTVITKPSVLRFAGVRSLREAGAAPLFLVAFVFAQFVSVFLTNWISRAQERRADLDSLEFTRDADAFADAMHGLLVRNMADLAPTRWQRVRVSHPTAAERLALGEWWRASRRVTVLFTDIENSTALLARLGDEGWFGVRRDHNELIRASVEAHHGTEVDSAGDGFLLVFEDAGEALLCAVDCQRSLDAYNREHPDAQLSVRMGLHTGEVIRQGREVVGREVHLAARVASSAKGGEILATPSVKDAVAASERFAFDDQRALELKGFEGMHEVWRVRWIVDAPVAS